MTPYARDERLEVFPETNALADRACEWLCAEALAAVAARGRFTLALSGGSTPRAIYQRLAKHPELPWDRIELCFGDERTVPPDHPDSNARMAHEALTGQPFVRAERVHRIRAELPPDEAASDYEHTLRALFAGQSWPRFDVVLLGLGSDGHTASLFPHSQALTERTRWVVANWVEKLQSQRITLSYPAINAAARVLFMVAGEDKAAPLRDVLEGNAESEDIPARGVAPSTGELSFFVDRTAATLLQRR